MSEVGSLRAEVKGLRSKETGGLVPVPDKMEYVISR